MTNRHEESHKQNGASAAEAGFPLRRLTVALPNLRVASLGTKFIYR